MAQIPTDKPDLAVIYRGGITRELRLFKSIGPLLAIGSVIAAAYVGAYQILGVHNAIQQREIDSHMARIRHRLAEEEDGKH